MNKTLLVLLLLARAASAATVSVAVMPFKDLMAGKGSVGEAIRETVTTDLKQVQDLRVIERSAIDKVLGELKLQEARTDLDPSSSVKLGKLLGATHIVAGSYQSYNAQVRLNARFVSVETGEIVGAAKVDGKASEFLALEDRITVELLKSVKMAPQAAAHVERHARKPRPKLRSMKTVELYGQAVVEQDADKKVLLLKAALSEDPEFSYASKDLDELEQRLKIYDVTAAIAQKKATEEYRKSIAEEKDPQKLNIKLSMLLSSLMSQRRWRELRASARAILDGPDIPPGYPGMPTIKETAAMEIVYADDVFRDLDAQLRDGEKFMAAYPTSNTAFAIRMKLEAAITEKRNIAEGARLAEAALEKLSPAQRADPCSTVGIYASNKQWKALRKTLESMKPGQCLPVQQDFQWMNLGMSTGDFRMAREAVERMKVGAPELAQSGRMLELVWPID